MSSGGLEIRELDAVAARWREAWGERAGGFARCCTPDVQYEDPVAVEPLRGVDALERHAGEIKSALPDLRIEASAPVAGGSGPHVCVPWRALGTQRGRAGGLPPTGRFVVLHGVHYLELHDGLVRRARGFFDLYGVAVQLGLLPERGSLGETAILMLRGYGLRPRA